MLTLSCAYCGRAMASVEATKMRVGGFCSSKCLFLACLPPELRILFVGPFRVIRYCLRGKNEPPKTIP